MSLSTATGNIMIFSPNRVASSYDTNSERDFCKMKSRALYWSADSPALITSVFLDGTQSPTTTLFIIWPLVFISAEIYSWPRIITSCSTSSVSKAPHPQHLSYHSGVSSVCQSRWTTIPSGRAGCLVLSGIEGRDLICIVSANLALRGSPVSWFIQVSLPERLDIPIWRSYSPAAAWGSSRLYLSPWGTLLLWCWA